jgi:hypothetical protein
MAQVRHYLLIAIALFVFHSWAAGQIPKFAPDDPLEVMPPPLSLKVFAERGVDKEFDFLFQSARWEQHRSVEAGAINTVGEVPDSEWFTNRHGRKRMSRDELKRGPVVVKPSAPYTVVAAKREGIMPGFEIVDAKGLHYFVKGDSVDYPDMATGAEVIVSKFFYALGYNTPGNEILYVNTADLRGFTPELESIIRELHHQPDGSFRVVASLGLDGEPVGPFKFEGTRADDPNDITPHQHRRDLRGLYVFSAWLNHTDSKALNTLDTVIEENGIRYIRHHLIDFASALGSDGDRPKDPRFGHEFMLGTPGKAFKRIITLGAVPADWERTEFPKLRGVGNFEWKSFDPDKWKSNYPNLAFLSRLPDDDFWAAKNVMAFTDHDIRAIVETARYGDPRATDYVTETLVQRRNMIGRTFFAKVLPLDNFRVESGTLSFDDLAVQYGFRAARNYDIAWSRFNNMDRTHTPIAGSNSMQLPVAITQGPQGSYAMAVIGLPGARQEVSVYVRKERDGYKVVGVERSW